MKNDAHSQFAFKVLDIEGNSDCDKSESEEDQENVDDLGFEWSMPTSHVLPACHFLIYKQ